MLLIIYKNTYALRIKGNYKPELQFLLLWGVLSFKLDTIPHIVICIILSQTFFVTTTIKSHIWSFPCFIGNKGVRSQQRDYT